MSGLHVMRVWHSKAAKPTPGCTPICVAVAAGAHLLCVRLSLFWALEHHQLLCISQAQVAVGGLAAAGNLLPAMSMYSNRRAVQFGQRDTNNVEMRTRYACIVMLQAAL
jgi:hypothetical protein